MHNVCSFQETQSICITFIQRRSNVFDVGPTLYKCYTNILWDDTTFILWWLSVQNVTYLACRTPPTINRWIYNPGIAFCVIVTHPGPSVT